jgi:hypothetical protein
MSSFCERMWIKEDYTVGEGKYCLVELLRIDTI